jgi:uncharacterized protein
MRVYQGSPSQLLLWSARAGLPRSATMLDSSRGDMKPHDPSKQPPSETHDGVAETTGVGRVAGDRARLTELVQAAPPLMRALRAARAVDAPDWFIAAGAIRDAVWDVMHDRRAAVPRDIDLIFYASGREDAEAEIERSLRRLEPGLPWQVKNQATVHTWYPERFGMSVEPFADCGEALATFPETAACVGVRLLPEGGLMVVAPYGLDDLLDCVCRHNPARVTGAYYEKRVREKGWRNRWPKMRYIPPAAGG